MKPCQSLTDADYAALADLRYALRRFLAFSEGKAGDCGLTPQQHQALLAIRAAPANGATTGFLAERLLLKPHSATGLVDRLVALDLLTRRASSDDRRQAFLDLTEKAETLLAQLSAVHREELVKMRPMLTGLLTHF